MKRIFLVILFLSALQAADLYSQSHLSFTPRRPDAMSGSEFIRSVAGLTSAARDSVAYKEITEGNMPGWLTKPVAITDSLEDAEGKLRRVTFYVLPDFLAIGSDSDFFRVPLMPVTAQRIADFYSAILATRKISDIVHRFSEVKMVPHPMTPDATMITVPVFANHDSIIEQERAVFGKPLGSLIAGHKKDIIISNRMESEPGRLLIYGWHYPDGTPIQRITSVHHDRYVDYSHGTRLVGDCVTVDGKEYSIKEILRHPVLYRLLSDEDGPMNILGYRIKEAE